jgi:hypothetical protein
MVPNTVNCQPGLYIRATQELISRVNQKISISIQSTNSSYDGLICLASLQPSVFTAGFRPNFQYNTDTLVILPKIIWSGYPYTMGSVEILM